jgi:predicted MFS family arabinose efflux permease
MAEGEDAEDAVVMNLGIFGAVAVGPVLGEIFAQAKDWRWLFWATAIVGCGTFVASILTYERQEPQDRTAPVDVIALALASGGCAAAFFGASQLATHRLTSTIAIVPMLAGGLCLSLLILHEYSVSDPFPCEI